MWNSMAYYVARTLHFRPLEILLEWTCEELLVAFAFYANQNSSEYFETLSKKDRYKKGMTELDRWAVPFVSESQLEEMNKKVEQDKHQLETSRDIAAAMFG